MPPPYLEPLHRMVLESQSAVSAPSGEPLHTETPATSTDEEIVGFSEESSGFQLTVDSAFDSTMDRGLNNDSQLGNFLQRPIRIAVTEWQVGSNLLAEFNPWELLHDNPIFRAKIQNFELLRHKLCLKFVISGTQFHYGRVLVSYNPYFLLDEVTKNRTRIPADLINSSQKPHIWLDPANNQGGEMCLPFFYPRNFVSITQGDHRFLGKLDLQSTQPLRHANGGDDSVFISVFAWAEDVKLSVPTSIMPDSLGVLDSQSGVLTAGDEYGRGIISKPASAVAKAAGLLTRIPAIRPYARATEMVAATSANLAALFGFSRPAILSNPSYYKPFPQGNLPNVDTHETVTKLALDSKNEVTIDPRVVGLDSADEMGIVPFVMRESYLTSFDMTTADGIDNTIFESRVLPMVYDTNTIDTVSTEYHLPPMAYMANAFEYWHGSITYKFQIVKSKFHKGKILLQYDPSYFVDQTTNFNTNYSRVIDLASEDEFEFTIGWCQAKPWLKVPGMVSAGKGWSDSISFGSPDYEYSNGMFKISVLNGLVSPALDTPISFNVFVKMEEDAKFAQPTVNGLHTFSFFDEPEPPDPPPRILDSQSGTLEVVNIDSQGTAPTGAKSMSPINQSSPQDDQYLNVFFGESLTSLRELLKRYTKVRVLALPDETETSHQQYTMKTKIVPFQRGYDTSSSDRTTGGENFTYVSNSFLSYFMPCYAGWRGALRKKYAFPPKAYASSNPTLSWSPESQSTAFSEIITPYTGSETYLRNVLSSTNDCPTGGMMTTNLGINDTLEVEIPYYKDERFVPARALKQDALDPRRIKLDVGIAKGSGVVNAIVQQYEAVGEDFSLHFFTGTPILHAYSSPAPENI